MDRAEILQANPLVDLLSGRGIKLFKNGLGFRTNSCPIVPHKTGHHCVSIDPGKQVWHCNDCTKGGSVIDWLMHESGKTAGEVLRDLDSTQAPPTTKPEIVATYDYTNESGKLIFQVVRLSPKSFRQRQPDGAGWKWGIDGIVRVLFNLPKVLTSQEVLVCEGEKDCLTAGSLGFTATCNAGGASAWLNAYADALKGKDVIIIPDSDSAGEKYAESVIASLSGKAASIKQVRLPSPHKDLSDYVASHGDRAMYVLTLLINSTAHIVKPAPLYSLAEMEIRYREFVRTIGAHSLDLGKFLPSLGAKTRKLVPGELVLILADTGVGKSICLQSIAKAAAPLPTLFFELELPLELMFERFVQMHVGCRAADVETDYQNNSDSYCENFVGLSHIVVCPESGLTMAQIESYIERSELKFGKPPVLVCIDYIGLIRHAQSRSRYEAVSESAEQMKVLAKRTGTIIVMASQVARPSDKKEGLDVRLHDAKDSGALENSAGLVLGCWRPEPGKFMVKILKNTKGQSGDVVECNFDGSKMRITE